MGKEKRTEYRRLKTLAGTRTAAFKEQLQAARRELKSEEHLLVQLQNSANEVQSLANRHALPCFAAILTPLEHRTDCTGGETAR